jgi:membrane protein
VRTLKGFRANQGLLLAGAVAYYALLSIVPMLIMTVIALSRFVEQAALLQTLGGYLEWLVLGSVQSHRGRARERPLSLQKGHR